MQAAGRGTGSGEREVRTLMDRMLLDTYSNARSVVLNLGARPAMNGLGSRERVRRSRWLRISTSCFPSDTACCRSSAV